MSHTPAPWIAKRGTEDEAERWCVYTDGPLNYHIATIENGAPGDTLETEGGNAHLIAAAPVLLLALQTAIETIRAWHNLNAGSIPSQQEYIWKLYQVSPEMKMINAALAAAEAKP